MDRFRPRKQPRPVTAHEQEPKGATSGAVEMVVHMLQLCLGVYRVNMGQGRCQLGKAVKAVLENLAEAHPPSSDIQQRALAILADLQHHANLPWEVLQANPFRNGLC